MSKPTHMCPGLRLAGFLALSGRRIKKSEREGDVGHRRRTDNACFGENELVTYMSTGR